MNKHCSRCLQSFRHFSASKSIDANQDNRLQLLNTVLFPYEPKNPADLAKKLAKNIIYHIPGEIVVVDKPFGVSCLGYKQKNGGVFKPSRYDQRSQNDVIIAEDLNDNNDSKGVTLEEAIPILRELIDEPNLHFCMGLKRYVSGPVILPCSKKSFEKIKKSLFHANSTRYQDSFMYRALAICFERPADNSGRIKGYATFQDSKHSNEYIFVPDGKISRKAVSGKFAVFGEMYYNVLASNYGCSLIDLHFTKFSRHLPRLMLLYLGSPVLGDPIYLQRLIMINGKLAIVEPKDRYRSLNKQYEPLKLLERLGLEKYKDIEKKMPLFLSIYQSKFPLFGDKKTDQIELIARTKPPPYFEAMAKILNFDDKIKCILNNLQAEDDETEEIKLVGKDKTF